METNGDALRAKANEGLALWIAVRISEELCGSEFSDKCRDEQSCAGCILKWLNSEVKEN